MSRRKVIYSRRIVESYKSFTLCIRAHKLPELLELRVATNEDDVVASRQGVNVSRPWRHHSRVSLVCVCDFPHRREPLVDVRLEATLNLVDLRDVLMIDSQPYIAWFVARIMSETARIMS